MVRKIGFGFLWCIALYFIACTATGMIVGFIVGVTAHNPQNIEREAREKAFNTVVSLRLYLFRDRRRSHSLDRSLEGLSAGNKDETEKLRIA
jgi:predicted membrane metal-binding protein